MASLLYILLCATMSHKKAVAGYPVIYIIALKGAMLSKYMTVSTFMQIYSLMQGLHIYPEINCWKWYINIYNKVLHFVQPLYGNYELNMRWAKTFRLSMFFQTEFSVGSLGSIHVEANYMVCPLSCYIFAIPIFHRQGSNLFAIIWLQQKG